MKRWCWPGMMCLCICAMAAEAQTRYVSDQLVITFRTGPGSQFNITRNLTSGDRVEVLEEQTEYARVRLPDGEEGWVLLQYIQPEPTAALELATATRELDQAERSIATLQERVGELQTALAETQQALEESSSRAGRLDTELTDVRSASASAIETRDRNESLSRQVADLTANLGDSQAEISELRSRNRQSWFIVGAGVLFGGIVIGLVAPSLRRSRRSNW